MSSFQIFSVDKRWFQQLSVKCDYTLSLLGKPISELYASALDSIRP